MSTATTLRFSDQTRETLENIRAHHGQSTIQKTVDFLIAQHPKDTKTIANLMQELHEARQRNIEYERAIRAFHEGMNALKSIDLI